MQLSFFLLPAAARRAFMMTDAADAAALEQPSSGDGDCIMQMPKNTFYKMVKARGGWIEGDIARFPTVAAKDGFNRDCDDYASGVIASRKPARVPA